MSHHSGEAPESLVREGEPVSDDAALAPLVEAARRGDGEAWRELYARFTPRLRAEARRYRLGAADVDEVVQVAWVRCFERLDGLRSAAALPAWLLATCRNQAVGILREQRRCVPTDLAQEPPAGEGGGPAEPLEDLLAGEEQAALAGALHDLPRRQQVVVAALLEADATGRAYRQVAADLAMPVGSIGPTRQRAVAALRRTLRPASPRVPVGAAPGGDGPAQVPAASACAGPA